MGMSRGVRGPQKKALIAYRMGHWTAPQIADRLGFGWGGGALRMRIARGPGTGLLVLLGVLTATPAKTALPIVCAVMMLMCC
jgi:hypothetical protein